MKKHLTALAGAISVFTFLYLIGSFAQASFNIKEWEDLARGMIAFCAAFAIMGVLVFNYANKN